VIAIGLAARESKPAGSILQADGSQNSGPS
jgi:hypothetical protein